MMEYVFRGNNAVLSSNEMTFLFKCANCGKDSGSLKACTVCKIVKYCNWDYKLRTLWRLESSHKHHTNPIS